MSRIPLAVQTEELPPFAIGLIALGILIALLLVTLAFGKGRPHS